MTGVLLAIPSADFQLHNSLFLVAHFHNTIIGGVVFGYFAGFAYWFPKATGFSLNERLGKSAFWCWIIGFFTTFIPLYIVGMMGMTRRLNHIDAATGWQPFLIVAGIGSAIIALGVVFQVLQIIISIKHRKKYADHTGDPWNGRTLEWSTTSPPPEYNFAIIPTVHSRDAFWNTKYGEHTNHHTPTYEDIHMPKNTGYGIMIASLLFLMGFAFVWHITWLILLSFIGAIGLFIIRSFDEHTSYIIPSAEVAKREAKDHSPK
jgi:cytochrome o ubiquinol oxidase subunit 1